MQEYEDTGILITNHTFLYASPLYPVDLFTLNERLNGAIILHIVGVTYMFVALTIVSYEFLVPTLEAVIKKFRISDNVAAAIFMGIGLNATQFLISWFGLFVSYDDIGVTTIIGAGIFRILFLIGMCAICSKTVLSLKWFPLFRDCTFNGYSLFALFLFLRDNLIYWWEAIILYLIYLFYIGFMMLSPYLYKRVVLPCVTKKSSTTEPETTTSTALNDVHANFQEMTIIENRPYIGNNSLWSVLEGADKSNIITICRIIMSPVFIPLRLTLPDMQKPRHNNFNWYLIASWSFLGSIIWVAVFSYLLMWLADTISETLCILPAVMSVTLFAAGSSIPNLIWAVIMVRKGFGDLAVSCSIGSNIFSVAFCLPIPWLLYSLYFQKPAEVYTSGIECSISILLLSLKILTILIGCFKWRMTKAFGVMMILLYLIVIGISLLFEYKYVTCPF